MKTEARHDADVRRHPLYAYLKTRYRDEGLPIVTDGEALEWLVEQADVLEVDERTFLLIEATPPLLDFMDTFGADREDMEDDDPLEDDDPKEEEHEGYDYRNALPDTDEDPVGDLVFGADGRWHYTGPLVADKQVRPPHCKDPGGAS